MEFNEIKLIDFLMLFAGGDNAEMSLFNMVCTNNDTFPEKYRHSFINSVSLFAELYRDPDEIGDNILHTEIDYVQILPTTSSITDTKFNIPIKYDYNSGFSTPKIDEETGMEYDHSIGFVLHIILKTD